MIRKIISLHPEHIRFIDKQRKRFGHSFTEMVRRIIEVEMQLEESYKEATKKKL